MKLMLAEDEPGLSRALTAILQHSDYEVDTALDGLTALEYLLADKEQQEVSRRNH